VESKEIPKDFIRSDSDPPNTTLQVYLLYVIRPFVASRGFLETCKRVSSTINRHRVEFPCDLYDLITKLRYNVYGN
jgi:hypothetical protein